MLLETRFMSVLVYMIQHKRIWFSVRSSKPEKYLTCQKMSINVLYSCVIKFIVSLPLTIAMYLSSILSLLHLGHCKTICEGNYACPFSLQICFRRVVAYFYGFVFARTSCKLLFTNLCCLGNA